MPDETPKGTRKRGLNINETMVSGAMPGAEALKWTPPPAEAPPSLGELVALVEADLGATSDVHLHDLPAAPAKWLDPRAALHPRLKQKMLERGMSHLYRHQAQAVDAALAGKDVAVVTGTSSGKTLCYNLPVIHSCLSEPRVTALYLYPTKALAHDQLLKLENMLPGPDVRAGVYDGDTATATRALVRKNAHLILTNPDMLHLGILPQHETWGRFLKSLRYLVIDEMHVYRGILGSHVGCVVRRLLRLCEWYGARPQIVACSATVANPTELFFNLTSRTPTIINEDGAPRGRKTLILLGAKAEADLDDVGDDSPFGPEGQKPWAKASQNQIASRLMAKLVKGRARTMTFCRARLSTELVLKMARKHLRAAKLPTSSIESYRSGYSPKERKEIEKGLFGGTLRGIVTTNAMELGVDVGDLDAVILNGYPGSQASFWQQIGRAGRGGRDAVAVFLAHDDPLEQFLVRRPSRLLEAELEAATTNPANPQILGQHLRCAAFERPLAPSELMAFGDTAVVRAEELEASGELVFSAGRFYYPSHSAPAPSVLIRGVTNDHVVLRASGVEIAKMERWRALSEAHPGAVYLHRDKTYFVSSLNLPASEAVLEERQVDYYTQALATSAVDPHFELKTCSQGLGRVSLAAVQASLSVNGYRRVSLETGEALGTEVLELPVTTFSTVAVRIDLPQFVVDKDADMAMPSIHGLEHALLGVAPLIAGCERLDLASAWYVMYLETLAPCLFVYDRVPGGVGLAERLYESAREWFEAARDLLVSCPCVTGCPGCLMMPRCEVANQMLDKAGAVALLDLLGAAS